MHTEEEKNTWWGSYQVPVGRVVRWRIGPLTLRVQRVTKEWRIASERGEDPLDQSIELGEAELDLDLREAKDLVRVGVSDGGETVLLSPLLADRPVVTRPDHPFILPASEEVTLFVSTPLWLVAKTEQGVRLMEIPLRRPSDTWFGPNTREGELCYASVTACRLDLAEVPRRPHRALTPVRIINRADTPLSLDRLKLPVLHLSLFVSSTGDLWTQELELQRMPEEALSPASLGKGPPAAAGPARLLSPPREDPPNNMVVRAFSSLFK